MTTEMPTNEESTDTEFIDTDVAEIRLSGPAYKARTITVPGNASLDEVKRRAYLVSRHVVGYDFASIATVNGRSLHHDGTLDDEQWTGYEVDAE